MRRRFILPAALLIGLAAAVVFWQPRADDVAGSSTDAAQDDEVERAMLEAGPRADDEREPPGPTPEPSGAHLEGRGTQPRSGPVTVTVVTDRGLPVGNVLVTIPSRPDWTLREKTGVDGMAHFDEDLPWDGTRTATVHFHTAEKHPIVGPTLRVVRATLVPLVLRTVDAETGEPVPVEGMTANFDKRPGTQRPEDGVYEYMVRAGREALFGGRIDFKPMRGRVAWDLVSWSVPRSAYAERLEVVAPLRREVPVSVMVLDHTGAPCADALLTSFQIAGKTVFKVVAESDAYGNRHVEGVPYFRGERLTVSAGIPDTTAAASASVVLGPYADQAVALEIRLPKPSPTIGNGAIGLGGGSGYSSRGRNGQRKKIVPSGTVIARVYRYDGTPAVNALVGAAGRTGRTNESGRVVLKECLPGSHGIWVKQKGLFRIDGKVEVLAERTVEVELREKRGRARDIEVVDENGDPLPFALLRLQGGASSERWIDEVGGVQRLDGFTDHEGRRTFARIDPRVTKITAQWGSRKTTVDIGADETGRLRIVLSRP